MGAFFLIVAGVGMGAGTAVSVVPLAIGKATIQRVGIVGQATAQRTGIVGTATIDRAES